ncbi:MAG: hypothetical protein AAF460_13810 [Pseudomonadota bacterium]
MPAYALLDAHPLSVIIVTAAMLVTPLFLVCTFVFSGASPRRGLALGGVFLVWGAVMTWVCLAQVPQAFGPAGALIVPLCWLAPSVLLWRCQDWVLADPLSQRWLVGLQVWRVIGGVFLIEHGRENIPAVFAFPAGIGDLAVGVLALAVLLLYRRRAQLPHTALVLVLVAGVADFVSAFFFGYFSSAGPAQLFFPEIRNNTLLYPTGLIPLFLVPYAIFFHTLSWLSLRRETSGVTVSAADAAAAVAAAAATDGPAAAEAR